ncbi:tRNA (adenosine(37)-N6)-dimethylallyltransferase MiaA [Pajaroellobacter abortibovis]|uniref:tRNA dimethylallyltransferase n=1 Tax=Pajaroellobacter abortibovis TaxID=1882918 RepID=A0A1L6MYS7_9BACT|nr:tRNA (adenosine(37)-N6)-dimethylallyltransferase MiaA [Pajaroellobacter abortibovis]APS00656.1 tRNA (adenosine(37)-N6)-dimethylallyltransferase MiaA [Pajaroellobacter abortibovis]
MERWTVDTARRCVEEHPEDLLAIVGPTASGKTAFAMELAEQVNGEIVGADSVQVYREFDKGSGKPTRDDRTRIPHHLVDFLSPHDPWDVALFASRASAAIEEIRLRGRYPILCGGTFLWVKALLYGLAESPPADLQVRAALEELVEAEGRAALHQRLSEVDPLMAARLHPHDVMRVSRALEVYMLTGRPLSLFHSGHGFQKQRYSFRLLAYSLSLEELTVRIQARVHQWLAEGWIDEVRMLLQNGYELTRPMRSVGYKQICSYLKGELNGEELELSIVRATRIFARRQRTWLRSAEVTWLFHERFP